MATRVLKTTCVLLGIVFTLPSYAVTLTPAQNAANAAATNASCTQVASGLNNGFYWEIGDVNGVIASGSEGRSPPAANTTLYVDSASKWIFAAYVVELRGGVTGLSGGGPLGSMNSDIAYLQMGNGYDGIDTINNLTCSSSDTIASCYNQVGEHTQKTSDIGKFYYSGAQYLAMANNNLGLGSMNATQLAQEFLTKLNDTSSKKQSGPPQVLPKVPPYLPFTFTLIAPNPAASVNIDTADYALFLRNILSGKLFMHDALDANSWCTNPGTYGGLLKTSSKYCPTQSSTPPLPNKMSFAYSLGHWIETDPMYVSDGGVAGDGAYSAPGASGFYPWIDASKTYYGIVAPASAEPLIPSSEVIYETTTLCGQAIRKAFLAK